LGGVRGRGPRAGVGAVGAAALVWAAVALAADITCKAGKPCNGSQFDDQITGSRKADGSKAKAANDSSYAGRGNDVVDAGDGNDYVEGGPGDDKISGGDD